MSLAIRFVGGLSRLWLRYGCSDVKVEGLQAFKALLDNPKRTRGVLTFANHRSVVDDPLIWGVLPKDHYRESRRIRWTLGASDICFTNPVFRRFFTEGQVIETFRGNGIYQKAVDNSTSLLNRGHWVHIFPEGYVNQSHPYQLLRFRWGIARMLMETKELPYIVPVWIKGFEDIMPEDRGFPRFLPRLGAELSISFGTPLDEKSMDELERLKELYTMARGKRKDSGMDDGVDTEELQEVRKAVCDILQEKLQGMGKEAGEEVVPKY
ncbi:acyltransferase-domain-containing protein [Atractiella rhizophila]|nr:acyltransferase-domain-containing protein [Atractiella rhizophila]